MERKRTPRTKKTISRNEADPPSAPANTAAHTAEPDPIVQPEEIARLAYSFWGARGCQGGSPEEDWLRAEQELKARRASGCEVRRESRVGDEVVRAQHFQLK